MFLKATVTQINDSLRKEILKIIYKDFVLSAPVKKRKYMEYFPLKQLANSIDTDYILFKFIFLLPYYL